MSQIRHPEPEPPDHRSALGPARTGAPRPPVPPRVQPARLQRRIAAVLVDLGVGAPVAPTPTRPPTYGQIPAGPFPQLF